MLTSTSPADESVTLAWDASPDENIAGYRLHYGLESENYSGVVDVGNNTTGTISGLSEGLTYFIAVTAYNIEGLESPSSNEVSLTLEVSLPDAPIPPELPPLAEEPAAPPEPAPPEESPTAQQPPSQQPTPQEPTAPQEPSSPGDVPAPNPPPASEPVLFSHATYSGLIRATNGSGLNGFLTLRIAPGGRATGQLSIDGETYRWSSAFDITGRLALFFFRHRPFSVLALTLNVSVESDRIFGLLTDGISSGMVDLQRTTTGRDGTLAVLQGPYAVTFLPDGASPAEPQGYGVGLVNVSKWGAVRLTGTLADNTPVTSAGFLDTKAGFSFHTRLYGKAGFLSGKITFRDVTGESDADGTLLWSKPFRPRDSRFQPAFEIQLPVRASRYQQPKEGALLGGPTWGGNAMLSFTKGNLPDGLVPRYPVIIYMQHHVPMVYAIAQPITVRINSKNGLFQGRFTPSDGRSRSFHGVLFQKGLGYGCGMFLDWTQSGRVNLAPE